MVLAQLQVKQEEPTQTRKQQSTWLHKRMHWTLDTKAPTQGKIQIKLRWDCAEMEINSLQHQKQPLICKNNKLLTEPQPRGSRNRSCTYSTAGQGVRSCPLQLLVAQGTQTSTWRGPWAATGLLPLKGAACTPPTPVPAAEGTGLQTGLFWRQFSSCL